MALHEDFREYTKEEIADIKRKVCNYILHTGHMRGCMPDECKHWKEKNVKKKRNKFANDAGYNN